MPFPALLESSGNRWTGVFAPQVNNYLKVIEKVSNATSIIDDSHPGLGTEFGDTGIYDGCLGKLQRGEADLLFSGMDYPLDIANVSQGFIVLDEKVSFMGAFQRPAVVKTADFSRSLNSFHWSIYALIVAYLLMFALIFKLRIYLMIKSLKLFRKRKKSAKLQRKMRRIFRNLSFVDVIHLYCRSTSVPSNTLSYSILVMMIGLFSFFTFSHFNSLLNTERVVTEKAPIFESYSQIMKAEIKPVFFKGTTYYRDLKYAKKGSKSKMFWNWAVKKFGENNIIAPYNLDYLGYYVAETLRGKMLVFFGEIISKTLKTSICDLLDRKTDRLGSALDQFVKTKINPKELEDLQLYIRSDESAVSVIKSIVIGKSLLESRKFFAVAKSLFTRGFEHGHYEANMRYFERTKVVDSMPGATDVLGNPEPQKREVRFRCREFNVPVPKIPQIDHMTLENFDMSFTFCAALAVLSFLIFLISLRKDTR